MKSQEYTTIAESRELLELKFKSENASAKHTPLYWGSDKMIIVSGDPLSSEQIPAWTVGDLIESLPAFILKEGGSRYLEISHRGSVWKVCYGDIFQTVHIDFKEAVLMMIRYIFTNYGTRTRKDFLTSFFQDVYSGIGCNGDEYLFYYWDIVDIMEEWKRSHSILRYFGVCSRSYYKDAWLLFIEIDREECDRQYKEGLLPDTDYRHILSLGVDFFSSLYEQKVSV